MRRLGRELLDESSDETAQANLRDLERINRWFGGVRVALPLIRRVAPPNGQFSILDLGAGSGGFARVLQRTWPAARVVSLDHRIRNLRSAPPHRLVADAFLPPFAPASFDVVFCSLLLHHFSDLDVVRLLRTMRQLARRALVVVDLQRHPIARRFLSWTRWALGWHPVTLHDGRVSVDAAFTRDELRLLAEQAGLDGAVVRRHPPWFRLSLVAD